VQPIGLANNPFQRTLLAERLQKLKRLGLAEEVVGGSWKLNVELQSRLRELGVRGDIIKTVHRNLKERGETPAFDYAIYNSAHANPQLIVGGVVSNDLSDEITDRRYVIVAGADGYGHSIDLGLGNDAGSIRWCHTLIGKTFEANREARSCSPLSKARARTGEDPLSSTP